MRRSFPLKVKLLVIQSLVLLHILHACSMYLTVRPPTTSGERRRGAENTSHLLTPLVMRHNIHTWFSWAN